MKVAFVGLGIMGRPMALNLMKAGHKLTVHARREESMAPLVEAGAKAVKSPADAARGNEVIFTMVSDTPDVESVIFGEKGIASGAAPGSVVVDMSSISPTATREMAERLARLGVDMLDAPVSGGDIGAINATLSIMVGGKEAVFDRVKPLLETMGKNIVYMGGNGAGQVTKLANNLVIAATMQGVGEALVLATKAGVDPSRVRQALMGGLAGSKVLENHGLRVINNNFEPGFKAKLHMKDIKNAVNAAQDLGVALPATNMSLAYFSALVGQGMGELDCAAMIKMIEQLNGVKIAR